MNVGGTLQNRRSVLFSECKVSSAVSSILKLYSLCQFSQRELYLDFTLNTTCCLIELFRDSEAVVEDGSVALDRKSCFFDSFVLLHHGLLDNLV